MFDPLMETQADGQVWRQINKQQCERLLYYHMLSFLELKLWIFQEAQKHVSNSLVDK